LETALLGQILIWIQEKQLLFLKGEAMIKGIVDEFDHSKDSEGKIYDFGRDPEKVAEEIGCVVVYPKPNQLQIDLDSEEALEYCSRRLRSVHNQLYWETFIVTKPSNSGLPHRHMTITVQGKEFSDFERVALQMMFGSDPIRESINAMRCAAKIKDPICFFEPKPRA
jgi:hypothetical protein